MMDEDVLIAIVAAAGNVTAAAMSGRPAGNAGDTAASILGKAIRAGVEAAREALEADSEESE